VGSPIHNTRSKNTKIWVEKSSSQLTNSLKSCITLSSSTLNKGNDMDILEIEKLVEKIEEQADGLFGIELKRLNVIYTKRGTAAGTCTYNQKYNFNLQIAQNNDGFDQTVYHEVAHQIAVQVYGYAGKGHGRGWQTVMRTLGRNPDRCHNYSNVVAARKTKKYDYSCGCGRELVVSSVRYNKVMRGIASYRCRCGRTLEISKAVLRR